MSKLGTKGNPYIHDPDGDDLDYTIDWNGGAKPFLGTDTISTSAWGTSVPAGMTTHSPTNTTTKTMIWVSALTVGTKYAITNHIVTAGGRTKDQTIYIKGKQG